MYISTLKITQNYKFLTHHLKMLCLKAPEEIKDFHVAIVMFVLLALLTQVNTDKHRLRYLGKALVLLVSVD